MISSIIFENIFDGSWSFRKSTPKSYHNVSENNCSYFVTFFLLVVVCFAEIPDCIWNVCIGRNRPIGPNHGFSFQSKSISNSLLDSQSEIILTVKPHFRTDLEFFNRNPNAVIECIRRSFKQSWQRHLFLV